MQQEPEPVGDDGLYELDRKAWNLPRPRPKLTIVTPQRAMGDGSEQEPHPTGDAEPEA
jgi:hypothetical protein